MPISNVSVGQPITDTLTNQLIDHVNGTNGRAMFVSNGNWRVPAGVHKFKVTLCGGGGRGQNSNSSGENLIAGGEGGDSPMISAVLSGYDTGTTFVITIGAGGTNAVPLGGTTSFGAVMSSSGGDRPLASTGEWYDARNPKGPAGAPVFPAGAPHIYHCNEILARRYRFNKLIGYGKGGLGGPGYSGYGGSYENLNSPGPEDGEPGVVLIEW